MRMKLMMAGIALVAVPLVFAQSTSHASKSARMLNRAQHASLNDEKRPIKVSGEGISMPSGVKYWDVQTGSGNPAAKGHVVKVMFMAWVENGKMFDGSTSLDKPTIFTLGYGQVIPGWEEGMEGMKVGGVRQLKIPSEMAYGASGMPPVVPPNSTLIFDVKLIGLD